MKFWTIQLINQDFKTQLIDTFLPQLFDPLWSCGLKTPGLFVQEEIKGGGNCKLAFHKACQASTKNHPEPSEMRYFEVTGDLPPMLNQLHLPYAYAFFKVTMKYKPFKPFNQLQHAISSIPATSVEVERLFSAAGCFVTKLRTRLQDDMADTLCFLRSYFLKTWK